MQQEWLRPWSWWRLVNWLHFVVESMRSAFILLFFRSISNYLGGIWCRERGKVNKRCSSAERTGQKGERADPPKLSGLAEDRDPSFRQRIDYFHIILLQWRETLSRYCNRDLLWPLAWYYNTLLLVPLCHGTLRVYYCEVWELLVRSVTFSLVAKHYSISCVRVSTYAHDV